MKKILFVTLFAASSFAFAIEKDCSQFNNDTIDSEVVTKVQNKGVKSLTINYSKDLEQQATLLKNKLQAANVAVTTAQVDGSKTCEMTNFTR